MARISKAFRFGAFACALSVFLVGLTAVAVAQSPQTAVLSIFHRPGTVIPNVVAVSVGGGQAVHVTFDTGSVGLRILAQAVGPNVRRTDRGMVEAYGDGTIFKGVLAYAQLSFPTVDGRAVQTVNEVPIQLVTQVSCAANHPHCPGMMQDRVGVMGLRYNAGSPIFNPLASLPGNLASGFIFDDTTDHPTVTVGLTPENMAGFHFGQLQPSLPTIWPYDGHSKGWVMASLGGCFSVGGASPACSRILFDTGSSWMLLALSDVPPGAVDKNGFLQPGETVHGVAQGLFDYAFTTTNRDRVMLARGQTNIGEPFFRQFLVLFDEVNGRIGFKPR